MVDFDLRTALELTASGVGAAFVGIVTLVVLTLVSRRLSLARDEFVNRRTRVPDQAPVNAASGEPSEGRESLARDAELASAIGAAVATAIAEEERAMAEAGAPGDRGGGVSGWKSYGIWQAMQSRRLRGR